MAKATNSCGLLDTKWGAMTEISTQPGAAVITRLALADNTRLRKAKKPISRVE